MENERSGEERKIIEIKENIDLVISYGHKH
jgi:predicted transcriptional regulator